MRMMESKGVFRTLGNISGGGLNKRLAKEVRYFLKKLHPRCLTEF